MHGELLRISGQCVPADVGRFPALQERMMGAVESFINDGAVRGSHDPLLSCQASHQVERHIDPDARSAS